MEENRNLELGSLQEEEKSAIDFQLIYSTLILNWKWFVLSIIVCLGLGYLYLKCAKPVFQTTTKVLIKDDQQNKRGNGMNSTPCPISEKLSGKMKRVMLHSLKA